MDCGPLKPNVLVYFIKLKITVCFGELLNAVIHVVQVHVVYMTIVQ